MSPQGRLHLFLVIMLFIAALGTGIVSWLGFQRQADATTARTALLLMEAALGIRSYTHVRIRPELEPMLEQRFLPQIVPSFAAIEALAGMKERFPDYTYREAALNPTNRRDLALPWEEVLIRQFQADPLMAEQTGRTNIAGKEVHYTARPIKISDPTCLRCHSTPAVAPRTMIATYGDKGGFGWALGDIVGAQIVTVPVSVPQAQAWDSFLRVIGGVLTVFLLLYFGFAYMLRKYLD
jgi:Protein of unknown function (DUF3365)